MAKNFTFDRDDVFPSWWANAIQEALTGYVANFLIRRASLTSVEAVAAAGDLRAVIMVQGRWRYRDTNVTASHPGGAAGDYPIFVTATETDIDATPQPFTDNTDYAYGLVITAVGGTPGGGVLYRRVGTVTWDGAKIVRVVQTVGGSLSVAESVWEPGDSKDTHAAITAGAEPPGWLLKDGRAVSRTTYSALYAALGGGSSPHGQGDGSTTFNVPDDRGRVTVMRGSHADVDTLGDNEGAALANRTPKHQHTVVAAGSHAHGGVTGGMTANNPHGHSYTDDLEFRVNVVGGSVQASHVQLDAWTNSTAATDINHGHPIGADGSHVHPVGPTGTPTDGPAFTVVNRLIKT